MIRLNSLDRWSYPLLFTTWGGTFRRMAAPTISAFLCFLFVVIEPLNRLAGNYSFLTYTSFILFFMPRGTISGQLETTVLGMAGVIIGLGWSCIALSIACVAAANYGSDSSQSRAVLGLGLGLLALACGFVRSYYTRFSAGSRIGMFYSIFLITSNQDVTTMTPDFFTNQLAVAGFSAVFALVPALIIFPHTSQDRLCSSILGALHTTSELFPLSLGSVLLDYDGPTPVLHINQEKAAEEQRPVTPKLDSLVANLKSELASMRSVFKTYRLEIVRARVRPSSLTTLIHAISKLQRNPLLGTTRHIPGERIRMALERSIARGTTPVTATSTPVMRYSETPASHIHDSPLSAADLRQKLLKIKLELANGDESSLDSQRKEHFAYSVQQLCAAVSAALAVTSNTFAHLYDRGSMASTQIANGEARQHLKEASDCLDQVLGGLLGIDGLQHTSATRHAWDHDMVGEGPRAGYRDTFRFRSAFYLTALRDLAKDVQQILIVVINLSEKASEKRWFRPSLSVLWNANESDMEPNEDGIPAAGNGSVAEDPEDLQRSLHDPNYVEETLLQSHSHIIAGTSFSMRVERTWRRLWDRRGILKARIAASNFIHHLRHSRHVLFAIKFASGISLLSLPAFLPPGTAGRNWYDDSRGAWTVISYMYVLEVTTGATFRIGVYRIFGTFFGALTAFVCTLIARENPYGLVALATACSVPIHYGMLFSKRAPLAVVAGITLPPILFLPYLGLNNGQAYFTIAWTRFVDITIGIVAAVLVNITIWPIHARVRYFSLTCEILDQCSELYLRMSRDNLRASLVYRVDAREYTTLEEKTMDKIAQGRGLVAVQRREVSLLPRPVKLYLEIIDSTERLVDILADIRTLRFGVPRQATVLEVLPLRQEVVSSVLIALFALSHSFRSRTSLPQFIPSPRRALGELMEAIDQHARRIRLRRKEASGAGDASAISDLNDVRALEISIVYAMAEGEALNELCLVLDQLVAAARTLFGTRAFLDVGRQTP